MPRAPWRRCGLWRSDHDQTDSQACARTPRLAAGLRTRGIQRLWVLFGPWAGPPQVLLHARGGRRTAPDEMRQADVDLGGGGAGLAAGPRAHGRNITPAIA